MRRRLDSQEVQWLESWILFFNTLKLRETLNIGFYGVFKIQDSSQLRKTLQTARQRGGFHSKYGSFIFRLLSKRDQLKVKLANLKFSKLGDGP